MRLRSAALFQSTRPSRARRTPGRASPTLCISIHARPSRDRISTSRIFPVHFHPRAGATPALHRWHSCPLNFNPRPSRATIHVGPQLPRVRISIHAPLGARLPVGSPCPAKCVFQSTPLAGAISSNAGGGGNGYFNRAPSRARQPLPPQPQKQTFSIHAPLAVRLFSGDLYAGGFLSIHAPRGAAMMDAGVF